MEVPDKADDGVRRLGEPLGSFTENFIRIGHQEPCQKHFFLKKLSDGGQFWGSRTPLINFCCIQKMSNPIYFVHVTRCCVQKNPNFTHLAKKRFFWDTLYYLISKFQSYVFFNN